LPYRKFGESSKKIAKLVEITIGKQFPFFVRKKTLTHHGPPKTRVII
jgi:hypothetical protein